MWLCDLENAIGKVIAFLGANACAVCVESIKSCADGGIAFALSDGGYIRWLPDGEIVRREKKEQHTPPCPAPRLPSNGYVGGQMVRRMIAYYEGRMNNG